MKPSIFLSAFEKLEGLAQRLPEGLRAPIMRELTPVKTLFLLQRAPRVILLGERQASRSGVVNALFNRPIADAAEDAIQAAGWQEFAGAGVLRLLDARRPADIGELARPLAAEPADLCLFVQSTTGAGAGLEADLDHAMAVLEKTTGGSEGRPKMICIAASAEASAAFDQLRKRPGLAARLAGVVALADAGTLSASAAIELPPEAQLEMARLSGNKTLQKELAGVVIRSATAISGAVGAQPIPLADFPILTSLQAAMVASIMHVSGREMSTRLAGEFLGALGANVGIGLALREGSRAAVKLLPVWGNAISGAVAAAGTFALGRAATAYFIEGLSMADARRVFQRKPKEPLLLKG